MAPICEVCNANESKYKCPKCQLRYCSLSCYKSHKATHEGEAQNTITIDPETTEPAAKPPPATSRPAPKQDFTGLENDPSFQRLMARYPKLRLQLQAAYAMTIEPGPEDARHWTRHPYSSARGTSGDHRGRGRGRGRGGARGGRAGDDDDRQHGSWSREKGDKEALNIIKKTRREEDESDLGDGMREFVELCRMRFGEKQSSTG